MSLIVVKLGTNTLTTETRQLDLGVMNQVVSDVAFLIEKKHKVVIVSSGAITCGSQALGVVAKSIPEKQASASVGQFLLMKQYAYFFEKFDLKVGQILLTKDGLEHKERRQNAYNTLCTLLEKGVVPIINENDSVSIDEIQFGDNDQLSSQVAVLIKADQLIMLSDIDGLYTKDPRSNPDAEKIEIVKKITKEIYELASPHSNQNSRGGMPSKLIAAEKATEAGIEAHIANGKVPNILRNLVEKKGVGTTFLAKKEGEV